MDPTGVLVASNSMVAVVMPRGPKGVLPFGDRRRLFDRLSHENSDEGVGHGLGQRVSENRCVDTIAWRIAFRDELSIVQNDDGFDASIGWLNRFCKGTIESRFEF